jgi:hypothetical protein
MPLQTLKPTASQETILATLARDGACIIADLADAATVRRMTDEVMPFIARTPFGVDDFTGHRTQRTGALVARTPTCRKIVLDPTSVPLANSEPWSHHPAPRRRSTFIQAGSQVASRSPGVGNFGAAAVDRAAVQHDVGALDFTAANGADSVPGSHTWPWEQKATPDLWSCRRK